MLITLLKKYCAPSEELTILSSNHEHAQHSQLKEHRHDPLYRATLAYQISFSRWKSDVLYAKKNLRSMYFYARQLRSLTSIL
jgi:hypothetical protein